MNKGTKELLIIIVIIFLFIYCILLVFSIKKDKKYSECIGYISEEYCQDKGGVYSFDPWQPHVICNGIPPEGFIFFLEENKLMYIFNLTEINNCWD